MKLFAIATLVVAGAIAQTPDSQAYDVRHLRWGMRVAEALKSEPNLKFIDSDSSKTDYAETDSVAGVSSYVMARFKIGPSILSSLNGLAFVPAIVNTSGNYDDQLKAALFNWYDALTKRYGTGYLFLNDANIAPPATLQSFDAAVTNFQKSNAKLDVQFENSRTVIHLQAYVLNGKHEVGMAFSEKEPDNF